MQNKRNYIYCFCLSLTMVILANVWPNQINANEKVLVIGQAGDIAVIDNQQSVGPAKNALIQIYDWQWMSWAPKASVSGALVSSQKFDPGVIWAWETTEKGGKTFQRFHVRPGQVHHSGNPITAHDFKYALQRRAAFKRDYLHRFLGSMYKSEFLDEKIKIVDDYTMDVEVKRAMPLYFDLWAQRVYFDSKLMLKNATDDDPWSKKFAAKNDAGAGPYKIEKWSPGVEMVLNRFDKYWGPRPPMDKIIFKVIPDLSSRVLLLKRGEIDVALNLARRETNSLRNDPNIKIVSAPSTNILFIGMNFDQEPFGNKDLRYALSYAFPYDDIIPSLYQGEAQPLNGPIPTTVPGALTKRHYTTDLEKAKKHLDKSGLGNGLELTLTYEVGYPQHKQIGILFAENLKKIGVNLKLQQLPVGQFETGIRKNSLAFFVRESLAWIRTPEYGLLINYQSESSANPTGYSNKSVDPKINEAMLELDAAKRARLTDAAQEIIVEDAPWIWVAQPNFQLAMRKNIIGYIPQNTELHHFWLVDKVE